MGDECHWLTWCNWVNEKWSVIVTFVEFIFNQTWNILLWTKQIYILKIK